MKEGKNRVKQAFFGIALFVVLAALCAVSYYSIGMRVDAQTEYYERNEQLHQELQEWFDTVPSIDSSGF